MKIAGSAKSTKSENLGGRVEVFGTNEAPVHWEKMQVGALSFLLSEHSLKRIVWHGIELVRGISWPIRDENWATYPTLTREKTSANADGLIKVRLQQAVDGGKLATVIEIEASRTGVLQVSIHMTPNGGRFSTNRAGLTVLHPILGLPGAPVQVTHSDGFIEDTFFPKRIKPSQPIKDIAGLSYGIGSASVEIEFEGEVFEMEDQRNWSDASFKTYCVPLKEPFTYAISEPVSQTVTLSFGGDRHDIAADTHSRGARIESTGQSALAVGLVVEDGWGVTPEIRDAIKICGASHLLARISPTPRPSFITEVVALAEDLNVAIDVELVLDDKHWQQSLERTAQMLAAGGLIPRRVIPLREAYLKSYQPNGNWPYGPRPSELVKAARTVFPKSLIGGGMLTNFTELNRCPPKPDLCDFVCHGNSATVHASDDLSVLETLETLPQIFESVSALKSSTLKGTVPYRLGLVSIAMRSNPYGTELSDNLDQTRMTMASADPRHRGLFAAAWAVGVLSATQESDVEALCLASPSGPFGLAYVRQPHVQPGFDDGKGVIYPLFHVIRQARSMAGAARVVLTNLPEGVVCFGVADKTSTPIMIANVSSEPKTVQLPTQAHVAILDTKSATAAMADPHWLDSTPKTVTKQIQCAPYAVAFAVFGA